VSFDEGAEYVSYVQSKLSEFRKGANPILNTPVRKIMSDDPVSKFTIEAFGGIAGKILEALGISGLICKRQVKSIVRNY